MIEVERSSTVPDGWAFSVRVVEADGQTEHRVTVARVDYERLTALTVKPEVLVEKTFEFLLAREPKEAILRQFELTVVARYFPEYETELKRALSV
jgi:hypothetical protein